MAEDTQDPSVETPEGDGGGEELPDFGDDLDKWKHFSRTNERAAKTAAKQLEETQQRLSAYEQAEEQRRLEQMSEHERAIEQARQEAAEQARSEERARYVSQIAETQVVAAATGLLANPKLALRLVDVDSFVDPEGNVDSDAIGAAVARLVEDEPYLAARETRPAQVQTGPRGGTSADGGINALIRSAVGR